MGCSNFRHCHWLYIIPIFRASIGKQVCTMVLDLSVINYVLFVSFAIFTWHASNRGISSTREFQLVCERTGTNRYIHIVRLECFAICCLCDIAIK